jgi:PAS domain-containing protein
MGPQRSDDRAASAARPPWLADALDQAADLILLTDARDRIAYVNRRSIDLLGVSPTKLVGEGAVAVVHPDSHAAFLDALRAARLGDPSSPQVINCALQARYVRPPVPAEMTLRPVALERQTVGCIVVARSLEQRSDSLAQRLASERVSAIGDLANQAADRINNPLAVLVTHIGIIEREAESGRAADPQSIEQMRKAIGRVADVTEELATIADTSVRKLLLSRTLADPAAVADPPASDPSASATGD